MSTDERAKQISKLLFVQQRELAEAYTWKAENIVRFFDKLDMTTQQKVEFLAKELAGAHMHGALVSESKK